MDIEIQSQDIIAALSDKIASLTLELEMAKIGLRQAEETNKHLSKLLVEAQNQNAQTSENSPKD